MLEAREEMPQAEQSVERDRTPESFSCHLMGKRAAHRSLIKEEREDGVV